MAGYKKYSMSNNAVDAYDRGLKPLSKWTKEAIICTIKQSMPKKKASSKETGFIPIEAKAKKHLF